MCAHESRRFGTRVSNIMAACALSLGALCAYSDGAFAQQHSIRSDMGAVLRVAELERAFWICDYTGTTRGLDATPVDVCSAVTDELKNDKFGGDFEKLLNWWRQNKFIEHGKLETVIDESGSDGNFLLRRDWEPRAPTNASGV